MRLISIPVLRAFFENPAINYPYRIVYVKFGGTHKQYDVIDAQTVELP